MCANVVQVGDVDTAAAAAPARLQARAGLRSGLPDLGAVLDPSLCGLPKHVSGATAVYCTPSLRLLLLLHLLLLLLLFAGAAGPAFLDAAQRGQP